MFKFYFDFSEYCFYRYTLNSNFRVKVDSRLVGFSGLVLSVGYDCAKKLVDLACTHFLAPFNSSGCHSLLCSGVIVSFYAKK